METNPSASSKLPWHEDRIPYKVHDFDTAEAFVDALVSSKHPWGGYESSEWCFRGQEDDTFLLTPALWRSNASDRLKALGITGVAEFVSDHTQNAGSAETRAVGMLLLKERFAVQCFLAEADRIGLPVRTSVGDFDSVRKSFEYGAWHAHLGQYLQNSVPDEHAISYALAQHHGIPTQLLDFTTDPLIAAYFAIPKKLLKAPGPILSKQRLAVWILHRHKLEGERRSLRFLESPRFLNQYLQSQRGVFVVDRAAAADLASGELQSPPCITRHLTVAFSPSPESTDISNITYQEIYSCHKLTLGIAQAPWLARLLANRGIRKSSLMPTFDNVANDVLTGTLPTTSAYLRG